MRRALLTAFLIAAVASATRGQAGATLPPWTPGTLDIHHINTGRGNAGFLRLPDGTTMLIDAGDGGNLPPRPGHLRQCRSHQQPAGEAFR